MKTKSLLITMRLTMIAALVFTGQFAFAALAAFAPLPATSMLALSDVDVSAITQHATANMKPLISTLVNSMDIANDISVLRNVKNKADMPKLAIAKGFKPYTGTFNSRNADAVYTNRQLEILVGQRDLTIDPEDYRGTFLAQFAAPGASPDNLRAQIPFSQYLNEQIIKKLASEINDNTAYFGFDKTDAVPFDAGDTYAVGDYITYTQDGESRYFKCITITSAGEDPDDTPAKWQNVEAEAVVPGIREYLSAITGANAVATGVINSAATGLSKTTTLYQAIDKPYRNQPMVMHVGYTDFDYIVAGILDAYGKYTMSDLDTTGGVFLPLTGKKCLIKPATWLGTSRRLLLEPANPADNWRGLNLHMGTDLLSDASSIKVLEKEYKLNYAIKFALGFQVADTKAIWIGDQA